MTTFRQRSSGCGDQIAIGRLCEAVAHLDGTTSICATVRPKGVPVQLIYENFVLSRVYGIDGQCHEVTDLLFSYVPHFIENEYLHSACNGDFELTGCLWLTKHALAQLNEQRRLFLGIAPYRDSVTPIVQYLTRTMSFDLPGDLLRFTPGWSDTLIGQSLFATYENFLDVMDGDFDVPDHITTIARFIHTIIPLYHQQSFRPPTPHTNETSIMEPTPEPDTLHLHHNDLFRSVTRPDEKSNIIVAVTMDQNAILAEIDRVTIEPDRFGRIHPVVTLNEFSYLSDEASAVHLPRVEDVLAGNYRDGDVIELSFVNQLPQPGRVLHRPDTPELDIDRDIARLNAGLCTYCHAPLTRRNRNLYCDNPSCCMTNYYRMLHASQTQVLDLPIDSYGLQFLHAHYTCAADTPVAALLNLGREELSDIVEDDCVDRALEIFTHRHQQLHGQGWSREVQLVTQGRFLDALSLQGLYRANIGRLQTQLARNAWQWSDLPSVLTDGSVLRSYDIPPQDAREIVHSARLRATEVEAFTKL